MPVNDQQELAELREEVRRLREQQTSRAGNGQALKEPKLLPPPKEPGEKEPGKGQPPPKPPFFTRVGNFVHRHLKGIIVGAILFLAAAIGLFFLMRYFNSYESTDDAQVDGHVDPIGSRISGMVTNVYVDNDYPVKAGEVLVEIDPRDYQTALDQAQAALMQAEAQFRAANPNVPITVTTTQTTVSTSQADLTSAQAGVAAAQRDYDARVEDTRQAEAQSINAQEDVDRYRLLVAKDEISRQQYDAAVATAKSETAAVAAAQASAQAAAQVLDQRRAQLAQARTRAAEAVSNAPRQVAVRRADVQTSLANVAAARARLEQARLNLSYTKVIAPVSGIIMERSAEPGEAVQPGEQLLSISQIADIWITANFKETQLRRMRPGQNVTIHVDAFDQDYQGYVAEMPGASGEKTSLLPPENATGNYVKVVQRLPVRIQLKAGQDPDHRLRPGMSCEPQVWVN